MRWSLARKSVDLTKPDDYLTCSNCHTTGSVKLNPDPKGKRVWICTVCDAEAARRKEAILVPPYK